MNSTRQQTFPDFGVALSEKVALAIRTLQGYQPGDRPYYGCFSGGKDSCVIKELARLADSNVEWHYNVTTIDPPEVHRFIRRKHPDVIWRYPDEHFFKLLAEKRGYPLRTTRWCCEAFKENDGRDMMGDGSGVGLFKLMGIRAAESPRRAAKWKTLTRWTPRGNSLVSWCVNPILRWTDADVWQFIRDRELPYCELYDEGHKRLGCIGCPMGGADQVRRDFARWPAYERAWRRAFHRLWERRRPTKITRGKRKGRQWPGFPTITTADELFAWWQSGDACPDKDDDSCQMGMF